MSKFFEVDGKHTVVLLKDENTGWKVLWTYDNLANVTATYNPDQPFNHQFESYRCFMNVSFDTFSYDNMVQFMNLEKANDFLYTRKEIIYHINQLSR